jgi:hypothetical protein
MHVAAVRIENVRSFGNEVRRVDLNFAASNGDALPKWVVLAGRNGAGKSTFLQALALAISGPGAAKVLAETFAGWINASADRALAAAHLQVADGADYFQKGGRTPRFDPWTALRWEALPEGPEPEMKHERVGGSWTPTRGPWAENPLGWFLAGYGPFRRISLAPTEAQKLMMIAGRPSSLASLFREAASLSEAVDWLQQVYLRRLEDDREAGELEGLVLRLLQDGLLPEGLEVRRVRSDGLWVQTVGGAELPLTSLSDGYRTVAALVLDIIRQVQRAYGQLDTDEERWRTDSQPRRCPYRRDRCPYACFVAASHRFLAEAALS